MAWENRNGSRYYYRKKRHGGRVVSEYIGGGELAGLLAETDRLMSAERERQRLAKEAARKEAAELDRQLDELQADLSRVTAEHLESLGYHRHKGQWRKKRDGD